MTDLEFGCQIPAWHWHWGVSELRDWAQGVDALGCDYITMADHILYAYARPDRPQSGAYTDDVHQHEVMTLMAWLAEVTDQISLQPNVLVLAQREPILVAKQAAEVDVLSGGRLRLGVGVGWQWQEFEALGVNIKQRPSRTEEYIRVLRACWTEEPISFDGKYIQIDQMSMMPKPVTSGGPPILFGGLSEQAMERAARMGDGWVATVHTNIDRLLPRVQAMQDLLRVQGRDVDSFPIQWQPPLNDNSGEVLTQMIAARDAGVSRLGCGMPNYDREGVMAVDEVLRIIEQTRRDVWPEVIGG